ncbi:MAG: HAD family hydrolase [Anaerolineaceae bacterium]
MPTKIEAVIFDMGGVILRSEDLTERTRLAKSYGLTLDQLQELVFESETAHLATLGKITEVDHWKTIKDTLNVPEEKRTAFEEAFWAGDRVDHELVNFLGSLRPKIKTGLLSNAWAGAREALIEKYACRNVFDTLVFSCEVGLAKPDPAIYELILERMKVKPEAAIFLDDFQRNLDAAAQLGIHAVRFINQAQAITDIKALL